MRTRAAKAVKKITPICPACKRVYYEVQSVKEEIDKTIAELQASKKDLERYYYGALMYTVNTAGSRLKDIRERLIKLSREEEAARHQASMPKMQDTSVTP